ncbi:hypothetical protein [Burkholderia gladioli]|uniref:hypothetical protein n=1 Tax=Burkholderia gladioli TaxID=28095 RepID=UPI00163ED8E1|nr:hypothetical protein [Burkholderia gladioli]
MDTFDVDVHWGDWTGSSGADDAHNTSISQYIRAQGLSKPDEFPAAIRLTTSVDRGGNPQFEVQAVLLPGASHAEATSSLPPAGAPVQARVVTVPISFAEFTKLFKRLDVTLSRKGVDLEGREIIR